MKLSTMDTNHHIDILINILNITDQSNTGVKSALLFKLFCPSLALVCTNNKYFNFYV